MKKYKYYLRLLCCLLCLTQLLTACAAHAAVPAFAPLPEAKGLRIAVGSDLHLNPDSRPGKAPAQAEFNLELCDALLWDAKQQGARFILLTGDLVNGATWRLLGDDASSSGVTLRATEKSYWIIPVGTLIMFR
jgi:hypothetical protein